MNPVQAARDAILREVSQVRCDGSYPDIAVLDALDIFEVAIRTQDAQVRAAAKALRAAQRAYMADRGNDQLGQEVARAAHELDIALGDT